MTHHETLTRHQTSSGRAETAPRRRLTGFLMPLALSCSLGLTAACNAVVDGDPTGGGGRADGTGNGPNGGGAGTGSGGDVDPGSGGAGTGGSAGGTGPVLPSECSTSTPGARLLRRLTRRELLNSQADVFGSAASAATSSLPGDAVDKIRLSNDASILMMGQDAAQALLDRAEEIADAVTAPSALPTNLPCASAADEACATQFIDQYGEALFRRPLEPGDVDRYLALHRGVAGASDFATGLKWTLVALIQSPHAVYRSELGQGGQLTPYEIASELSYDYSASPPDADLLAKAMSGSLADPEVRFQEAKRLLTSPRGAEVVRQFFEEWLSYRDVLTVARSNTPDDFETVRPKMVRETERFIDALLFEKEGKLSELMTADFTIADQDLSAYYGFPGGSGDIQAGGGTEVARTWGLGIFGQGSVTTTMASITITSPTRRGLLLLRRLLCTIPDLPQAVNFDLTANGLQGNTTRERLEMSHLQSSCKSCHQLFDPLGFGFEDIDHVGRYREMEVTPNGSFPIDATATVAALGGLQIDGQEELMQGLSTDPSVLACISGTMARYVYGGEGRCRAPETQARAMAGETSIVDYLAELAREPHFVQRN